jgi:HK97 family phage portal protein
MTGIVDRILGRVGLARTKFYTPSDRTWGLSRLELADKPLEQPYDQHAWIYACIRSIATRVGSVPYKLYEGPSEDPRWIEEGPLYTAFNRPNKLWSHYHLWEATITHLMLDGNALWVMDRTSPERPPDEVYVFPRQQFQPAFKAGTREIDHWRFQTKGKTRRILRLEPYQVAFFHLYNPYTEFWGKGPLEAARSSAEQDWLAQLFNRAFFENGADPGGIITVDRLTEDQRKRMRANWESRHQGPTKAFKIAFLEGGAKYQQLAVSHNDMSFVRQREMSREEICAVFHVPPSEVGIFEKVHKATAESVQKAYWEGTIIPLLRLVEDVLRAQFFFPYDEETTWGAFDLSGVEVLHDTRDTKIDRATKLFHMGVPFNEINKTEELGYEEIEGGNVGYLPINMVPAGTSPLTTPREPQNGDKALLLPERRQLSIDAPDAPAVHTRDHTAEQRDAWLLWVAKTSRIEQKFNGSLRTYLNKVRSWLGFMLRDGVARYEDIKNFPDDLLDLAPEFDDALAVIGRRYFKRLAIELQPVIEAELANAGIPFIFDPIDPEVIEFLSQKEVKIVENVNTHGIREPVRKALIEGKLEGKTVGELQEDIYSVMKDSRTRSLTIARTETAQASSGMKHTANVAAGVKTHQWVAALDERTRDTHLYNMSLGPWPLKAVFPNGCRYASDMSGPVGEVVNCRCVMMAVD